MNCLIKNELPTEIFFAYMMQKMTERDDLREMAEEEDEFVEEACDRIDNFFGSVNQSIEHRLDKALVYICVLSLISSDPSSQAMPKKAP